jgi:anaerobic dimethyl sulfoxide reductase subunit C (anchor subunit)
VLFTVLSQWSVGIVLCLALLGYLDRDTDSMITSGLSLKNPVFLALFFIGVATLGSFMHLGNPANAPRALNNLAGSWLSREILTLGVYSVCLLSVIVLTWTVPGGEFIEYLLLFSCLTGLVFLWMMIRIYMIPTIPAWNNWYTPVSFISTAICLGLLTFLAMAYSGFIRVDVQISRNFAVLLAAVLGVELLSGLSCQHKLEKINTGIDILVFDRGDYYNIFVLRMGILVIVFLAMLIIALKKSSLLIGDIQYVWMYLIFALVIAQEFMGRLLFYSSYFRVGV